MHIHLSTDSTSSGTNENINKGVTNGKTTEQNSFRALRALLVVLIAVLGWWTFNYSEGM